MSEEKKTISSNCCSSSKNDIESGCSSNTCTSRSCSSIDDERKTLEKKLVRKLDLTLLPTLVMLGLFANLDKGAIGAAKLNHLERDLGLKGNQFNVAVSIFFVGFILLQVPSNLCITRLRPSIYLPLCAMIWSVVGASTAAVKNYGGLLVVRLLLGIADAPFFIGAMHLLASWYTRTELALRMSIVVGALVTILSFNGLFSAAIFKALDQVSGLAGWRWLYIIIGCGGFLCAIISMFVLPDFPHQSGNGIFLSEVESRLGAERIESDRVAGLVSGATALSVVRDTVKDLRLWVFVVMMMSKNTALSFHVFFPTIVKGLHLGSLFTSLALTTPPLLLGALTSIVTGFSSDRRHERGYHIIAPLVVAIVGFIISLTTNNAPARYSASFLYVSGTLASHGLAIAWTASTLNESSEKRACSIAIVSVFGQFGSIWGPHFFPKQDAPQYVRGMLLMIGFLLLDIACCVMMKLLLRNRNHRLTREAAEKGETVNLYTL